MVTTTKRSTVWGLSYGAAFALLVADFAAVAAAGNAQFLEHFSACQRLPDEIARLRCYDALKPPGAAAGDEILREADVVAATVEAEEREQRVARLEWLSRREEQGMLTSDDPNYVVYATPVDDKLDDDGHVEFSLSLKYPLFDERFSDAQALFKSWENTQGRLLNALTPDRLLLHYSALYDFYVADSDRYDSAPILSRRQNPGVSLEYDFGHGTDTLRIGWFHESNGQSLEEDNEDLFLALREEFGEDFALSRVSRGWDYAMLRWSSNSLLFQDPTLEPWFNYQIEARFFCDCQGFGFIDGKEDTIWWEAGQSAQIADFDGLRGRIEGPLWRSSDRRVSLDARLDVSTGLVHSFGEHWSGRLALDASLDKLRFTLFYFDGYGRDPSVYHLRTKYAGFGLELR